MATNKYNIKSRPRSKMMLIDSDKLRSALTPYMETRNLTLDSISSDFGYGKNYVSNILGAGVISPMCARMIEKEFGIKYDDYKLDEPIKDEKKDNANTESTVDITSITDAIKGLSAELVLLNKKMDDLFAQTQLNGELLQGIKDNTRPNKPYAYTKGSH
jgi:hypothetical protein